MMRVGYSGFTLFAAALGIAPSVPAQLMATAVVDTLGVNESITLGPSGSLPAGTNVSSGYSHSLVHPTNPNVLATNSLTFVARDDLFRADLRCRTTGFLFVASHATSHVEITYTSATPKRVNITVQILDAESESSCGGIAGFSGNVRGEIIGDPNIVSVLSGTLSRTFQGVLVDSTGVRLDLITSASAGNPFGNPGCYPDDTEARIRVTVRPVDCATRYGSECGASWTKTRGLLSANSHTVEISDSSQLPLGLILLGLQPLALPMPWGCDLLVDPVASVPVTLDANGDGSLTFETPNAIVIQAGTLDLQTIHMTDAFDFRGCP